MDQDGHQGPDEGDLAESEEGWYFDLPSGAWERQETKNRELRELIRGNMTQGTGHEPFRGRKSRAEEPQGGLAGWNSRHMDEPEPAAPPPPPPEPIPLRAGREDPVAAWAGDGWDLPPGEALDWDDEADASVPTLEAAPVPSYANEDPFAEVEDHGDPELVNAMRAWAQQHDEFDAEPEVPAFEEPAQFELEPAPEPSFADAMRGWATAAVETPPAAAHFAGANNADDDDDDEDDGEPGNITSFRRPGEFQSSWRREKPKTEAPSRWAGAFEGAPSGENVLDSMRAWAEGAPVLPPPEPDMSLPSVIPEEFLKPFDWELDESPVADSDFPAFSGAIEEPEAPAPILEAAIPVSALVLPAEDQDDDQPVAEALLAEEPAVALEPAFAASLATVADDDFEDAIPPRAIPGFDDEDEIFASARAMSSTAPPPKPPPGEKKGGLISRLFGRKKAEAKPAVADLGPGEWVSADILEEGGKSPWSMAGMASAPTPSGLTLGDWEPLPSATDEAPAHAGPDVPPAWATLGELPRQAAEVAHEPFSWEPELPVEALAESPAASSFAWEWPRTDAAMAAPDGAPEPAPVTEPTASDGNDFTWDPEEFAEDAVTPAVTPPAAEWPAWAPDAEVPAEPVPAFSFEPGAPAQEPAAVLEFEAEPVAEVTLPTVVEPEPAPVFEAAPEVVSEPEPEAEPAIAFNFEPETGPEAPADPWAAFLAARDQDRAPVADSTEAAKILPFDEPRLMDETTASAAVPAASAADEAPEIAGAPAGVPLPWETVDAPALLDPQDDDDGDFDWNPEAFATATPARPVVSPEAPALPPAPAVPTFAWDDEPESPVAAALDAAPEPVSPLPWGHAFAPSNPAFAADDDEERPPSESEWQLEPDRPGEEPVADDPWAAVAAASGFESDSPHGIAVYRGHAEHQAQHVDTWSELPEAPADEDVVLRAFERHAAAPAADEHDTPLMPLEPLLGKDGVDVVDEFSPDGGPVQHHGFSRLSGWAPQRIGEDSPAVRPPLPRAGRADGSEDWGFEDDEAVPPWARPPVNEARDGDADADVPARRRRTLIREIVETGLLAALVFLSVRASFQNFKVDGTSMFPTLENGQFLIVNKLVYSEVDVEKLSKYLPMVDPGDDPKRNVFHGPQRGDIIVLEHPAQPGTDLIKRVIGLPGETLEVVDGHIYINDQLLDEPYIQKSWGGTKPKIQIPAGEYYVMGDNRDNSADSRSLGTIPEELIIGKAMVSYWPTSKFGLAPNASPDLTDQKPRLTARHLGD